MAPAHARAARDDPCQEVDVLRDAIADVAETALGRRPRNDELGGSSGGPAGNALLTAWTGPCSSCSSSRSS